MKASQNNPATRDILLIEDEGEMCLLLNLILDDKNLSVEHVNSLSAANAFLQKKQPALILLDNRLPDGFGFDYISYLKTNFPDIKIIMISGVDAAGEDFAIEAGADIFLPKPFTKAQLLRSVNCLLN